MQDEGKDPVTLRPGDSLLIKPGTVHAHWNASSSPNLVFTFRSPWQSGYSPIQCLPGLHHQYVRI